MVRLPLGNAIPRSGDDGVAVSKRAEATWRRYSSMRVREFGAR